MAAAADWFAARLRADPGCASCAMPAFGGTPEGVRWSNTLLASPRFRQGHVETLDVPGRLGVLHVCLFPRLDDPAPIFGFDMIAGPARVTGIFLDLSPVLAEWPAPCLGAIVDPARLANFAEKRALPPWGDIFSADMLAVRPVDQTEVDRAIVLAREALDGWLARVDVARVDVARVDVARVDRGRPVAPSVIAAGQARYVDAQRRNDHTWRMLSGLIGAEPARRFIDEILFPPVHME
jgi:phycocyanobilin:ferredoxin oxidoreductase